MARGRAVILTLTLIGINVTGGLFLWRVVRCRPAQLELAIILSAMVTVMIGAPLIAFLCLGWYTRYREFQNSLKGDALSAYLQRYWSKRLMQVLQYNAALQDSPESMPAGDRWRKVADERFDLCDRLFARIYHEQYGLAPFVPPFVILLTVAYAAASLVGCNYNPAQCDVAALKTCVYGISQQVLVGSCGGALMFVVSDAVLSIRRRSLNVSDVYWYALRILLAIPIALAVNGQDGTDGAHALAVFALGAFPVDALLKIVRRLGFPQFTEIEKKRMLPTGCFPSVGSRCRSCPCWKPRESTPSSKSPRRIPCCFPSEPVSRFASRCDSVRRPSCAAISAAMHRCCSPSGWPMSCRSTC